MPIGAALAWDDDRCQVMIISGGEDTYLVSRIRGGAGRRVSRCGSARRMRSLTPNAGLAAVTELCGRLGVIEALDAAVGPIKQRDRGFGAGELLTGIAAAQLAGEDFLTGLDRQRADAAGQQITPVPGLASTTAAGLARRITPAQWQAVEPGLAAVTGRMLALLPAERAAALAGGPVTIDLDTTDVEVYGRKKRGVAYNHQGQRVGRPHVAAWAETEIVLAADLGDGTDDPRATAPDLLRRALACLPAAARARAGGDARRRRVLRRAAGPRRPRRAHRLRDRRQADRAAVAAAGRHRRGRLARRDRDGQCPGRGGASTARTGGPPDTRLLIRRVLLDPAQVSADPRSRRRRTLHPDQRALPFPELASAGADLRLLVHPDEPGRVQPGQGGRRGALVPAPHHGGEHLPRQQARRRPAAPPIC